LQKSFGESWPPSCQPPGDRMPHPLRDDGMCHRHVGCRPRAHPGVIFIFFGDKNEEREKQHQ
jgi:hypothetical protein